ARAPAARSVKSRRPAGVRRSAGVPPLFQTTTTTTARASSARTPPRSRLFVRNAIEHRLYLRAGGATRHRDFVHPGSAGAEPRTADPARGLHRGVRGDLDGGVAGTGPAPGHRIVGDPEEDHDRDRGPRPPDRRDGGRDVTSGAVAAALGRGL